MFVLMILIVLMVIVLTQNLLVQIMSVFALLVILVAMKDAEAAPYPEYLLIPPVTSEQAIPHFTCEQQEKVARQFIIATMDGSFIKVKNGDPQWLIDLAIAANEFKGRQPAVGLRPITIVLFGITHTKKCYDERAL